VPGAEFWAVCEEPVSGEGVHWFGRVPKEKLTICIGAHGCSACPALMKDSACLI